MLLQKEREEDTCCCIFFPQGQCLIYQINFSILISSIWEEMSIDSIHALSLFCNLFCIMENIYLDKETSFW